MTYCKQSISGRVHSNEPKCRSICLRKVFPHEVQNIVPFKKHENVGPDGKAKYALPAEGQPINLPRLLGGTSNSDSEDHPKPPVTKYWDEGWYLWTGQSRWAFIQKTGTMMKDFQKQKQAELELEGRKEVWHDYQEHLKRGVSGVADQQSQFWGPIVPLMPMPNTRYVPEFLRITLPFLMVSILLVLSHCWFLYRLIFHQSSRKSINSLNQLIKSWISCMKVSRPENRSSLLFGYGRKSDRTSLLFSLNE